MHLKNIGSLDIFLSSFVLISVLCLFGIQYLTKYVSISNATIVLGELFSGQFHNVSKQQFVFTLSAGIISVATGFFAAYLLKFGVLLRLHLRHIRRLISSAKDRAEFTERYDELNSKLAQFSIVGHAWKEFDETLVKPAAEIPGEVIQNTVHPNVFLNTELARSKSYGLKMMPSIPGYFVGVGLLLTFIGLVIALHAAGKAVSSDDINVMQGATRELLRVASILYQVVLLHT